MLRRPMLILALLLVSFAPLAKADTLDKFVFDFPSQVPAGYPPDYPFPYSRYHFEAYLPASPVAQSSRYFPGISFYQQIEGTSYYFDFFANGGADYIKADPIYGPFDPPQYAFHTFVSPKLYTGTVENPTFLLGTFDANYEPTSMAGIYQRGTITISAAGDPASPVPEPGGLALLGTGALGLLTFVRRKRATREI